MWNKFAPPEDLDRERFAREMRLPPASIRYVMYFTPRSGSSWLTDLAAGTRTLSTPGECFNPNFMPDMTRALNARTIEEYQAILERRRNTNGVYGFQITYHQLKAVFGTEATFLSYFPVADWHSFWLIREDIVLQAVSLYKMQQTKISHAPQTSRRDVISKDSGFVYDGPEIKRWLNHILVAEQGNEEMFERAGIAPFRMSYERNMAIWPHRVINTMGRHLGLRYIKTPPIKSAHQKIGTGLNDTYARKFREEHADFMAEVDRERERTLALLEEYAPPART